MSIGAVSGSSYTPVSGGVAETKIKALDAQITDLQKKLQEVRDNKKLDEKTKSMQIQLYQKQIADLQAQKAELRSQANKAQQQKAPSGGTEKNGQSVQQEAEVELQKGFVQLSAAKEETHTLSKVRTGIENELRLADSKAYSVSPKADPEKAAKLYERLKQVNGLIADNAKKAAVSFEKADQLDEQAKTLEQKQEEGIAEEDRRNGTGRMEPGQFLDEEA